MSKISRFALGRILLLLLFVPSLLAHEVVFIGRADHDIHAANFDTNTGALTNVRLAAKVDAPSFLAIAPNRHFLYCVSEGGSPAASLISSFRIGSNGSLTFLNSRPAVGSGPCHLALDPQGKCLMTANYGSGSMTVFPVQSDGQLAPPSAFIQNHGSSVNAGRQSSPHAHCTITDPAGHYAFDCDLGIDKVLIYKLDATNGTLSPADPPFFATPPGAGPRHLAFHPSGRFAYLINELDSTMISLSYEPALGALTKLQILPLLPADFKGPNGAAEVAVHPSGRWVYGSNRGDDSIVVFACDESNGLLTFVQRAPSGGKFPRHFEIDPGGRFLLAANQNSGQITVFHIDTDTGRLRPAGQTADIPSPMCVKCLADE